MKPAVSLASQKGNFKFNFLSVYCSSPSMATSYFHFILNYSLNADRGIPLIISGWTAARFASNHIPGRIDLDVNCSFRSDVTDHFLKVVYVGAALIYRNADTKNIATAFVVLAIAWFVLSASSHVLSQTAAGTLDAMEVQQLLKQFNVPPRTSRQVARHMQRAHVPSRAEYALTHLPTLAIRVPAPDPNSYNLLFDGT